MKKLEKPKNVVSVVEQDIKNLQERKTQALEFTNPNKYVRERVFGYSGTWWDEYDRIQREGTPEEKRTAFIEFNKLQCRVLPTQLENGDSGNLTVQVMNYSGGMGTKDEEVPKK